MEGKPPVPVKQVLQVCVVVKNLEEAMERYQSILGIGGWEPHLMGPPSLKTTLRGKPQPYSMRIAVTQIGPVQWELIEPLEGPSIYKEFLVEKGEGLHHIAFATDDHDQTVAAFERHGIGVLMDGVEGGRGYSYMDTQEALGFILEIYRR